MDEDQKTRLCRNKACEYHSKGKCTLFPGWSFLNCRNSGIVSKQPPKTTNKKGKQQ